LASALPKNRAKTVFSLAHPGREDWHYTPRSRPGAPLGDMPAREQTALWNFLAETLNACGIEQMRDALKLERVLGELTNNLTFRDPNNYAIVFFWAPRS